MKRKQIYLTDKQIEGLKAIAEKSGLRLSEIIRRAIDYYLETKTK